MQLPEEVRAACRFFAFYLANGTLGLDVTDDVNVSEALSEPSWVEMAFAIFINVLDLDEAGHVTNEAHAMRRSAQYLHACLDNTYVVEPAFQDWETELPM
jgi:hypothetical protein